MLTEEAKWLGEHLCSLKDEYFPMVNIGSSTGTFRTKIQPHIDGYIFKPLRTQGKKVLHADIKEDEDVDLVGDLNDEIFIRHVKSMQVKSILCSNLLEHVTSPQTICKHMESILDPGGIIVVTVPYRYPYHKDPIDTKFRPSIDKLCKLFPSCTLLVGEMVTSSNNQARSLWEKIRQGNLLSAVVTIKRWLLPFRGMEEWRKARGDVSNLFKSYQITCVILKKN